MVDLETTGTRPDRHAIIQIAAVKFNLTTREVDQNFFNRCLFPAKHRSWSEDTRRWWMQRPETLRGIMNRFECPRLVMNDFIEWCGIGQQYRFWSKPASFDLPFIASYLNDYDLPDPFPYWEAMDLRSYLRGLAGGPERYIDPDLPFDGTQHDALFDVLHQIKILFHCADEADAQG